MRLRFDRFEEEVVAKIGLTARSAGRSTYPPSAQDEVMASEGDGPEPIFRLGLEGIPLNWR
jgi:hypothetical protein